MFDISPGGEYTHTYFPPLITYLGFLRIFMFCIILKRLVLYLVSSLVVVDVEAEDAEVAAEAAVVVVGVVVVNVEFEGHSDSLYALRFTMHVHVGDHVALFMSLLSYLLTLSRITLL